MTEFAHAVNYTISFGVTVLPDDINKMRKMLDEGHTDGIWDIELNKDSTDEEIANYIGLENYRDFILTEPVEMEMEDHHVYDAKRTAELIAHYEERLAAFKEANKK